jgi:hypothetical protein
MRVAGYGDCASRGTEVALVINTDIADPKKRRIPMPHVRGRWMHCLGLCCLALLTAAGCTIASSRSIPASPSAEVLPPDARALAYGGTTSEVLKNPEIADKVRVLFGSEWPVAAVYFNQGGPVQMVRIGGTDYIAVGGCVPGRCDSRHVLLLIEDGGSRLLARLDEGGLAHYYGYGSEGVMKDTAPRIVDSGYNALYYRSGGAYPRARS